MMAVVPDVDVSTPDSHTLVMEASAQLKGLHGLLLNLDGTAMHDVAPFDLAMLLVPIVERLNLVEQHLT